MYYNLSSNRFFPLLDIIIIITSIVPIISTQREYNAYHNNDGIFQVGIYLRVHMDID